MIDSTSMNSPIKIIILVYMKYHSLQHLLKSCNRNWVEKFSKMH